MIRKIAYFIKEKGFMFVALYFLITSFVRPNIYLSIAFVFLLIFSMLYVEYVEKGIKEFLVTIFVGVVNVWLFYLLFIKWGLAEKTAKFVVKILS